MVLISRFGMDGMYVFDVSLCGGYDIIFHVVLLFTVVLGGVGWVFCMKYCDICRLLIVVFIVFIWVVVPKL